MESESKKRKLGNEEDKGDDEEEVEKFFALIRSTREMRDRLRNVPNESKEKVEIKKKQEEKPVAALWNQTFRPEDFMEDSRSKNPLVLNDAGPSSKIEQEQKQEKETKEGEVSCVAGSIWFNLIFSPASLLELKVGPLSWEYGAAVSRA